MTDRQPSADRLPEEREEVELGSQSVGRPASAPVGGAMAIPEEPLSVPSDVSLTYEHGVELRARSQWAYARMRFLRHRLAVASLVVLFLIALVAVFADQLAPYSYDELDLENIASPPTLEGWHLFGTDLLGRDYLSRVIFGVRTSLWVAVFVAALSTAIGTAIGAIAGYYGGWLDNLLMRVTDLVLTLPTLAVLLTASVYLGQGKPVRVAVILALLFWTGLARIVRGLFLSLREKEFVEAARAAGASDGRIILRHILPNCVGPIVVTMTLIVATAILVEAALSFLGFGIQPPQPALGKLIAEGETEGFALWWLVTFPGLVIVIICLAINFVGDGLRDALDPTQRRVRA
ncbi:MAG TPA: ABC transporter permease [Gaiellaceae bacterium]|nr:ABC transporter permease [Gaiellaceae bacterium]